MERQIICRSRGAGPQPNHISKCRSCGTDIVFLRTRGGSLMPVNVVPTNPSFRGPNAAEDGYIYDEHQSHFETCDDAARFRR